MKTKTKNKAGFIKERGLWTGVPPWIIIGAVLVLLPIFALMMIENINRQKENSIRLLKEKGAALIRSFEAGTRTGMMGMHWQNFKLQKLLTETAQQPDIVYLIVTDDMGTILAHNDPSRIGKTHGFDLNLQAAAQQSTLEFRVINNKARGDIFEVFRRFAPTGRPMRMHQGRMWLDPSPEHHRGEMAPPGFTPQVIFIGLDMIPVEEARKTDARHTVIMGTILLLIGFAGIFFLFLAQSYRSAKASLSKIKAFSDTVVEHMPIGLVAIDTDDKVASANHSAGSILRRPVDDIIGKDAREVLPGELADEIKPLYTGPGVAEKEVDCTVYDGASIPLEVSARLLRDDKTILGAIVLFKDLTEVRALRGEIVRNQRMATVGRLAAGVAHEVRNPLSSIKGFATYFKERYRDVPEDQQISGIMIQEVDRLNRVVGQLLEFARPITITKKCADLKALIEDSLKLVEKQVSEKQIDLSTDFAPGIEAGDFDPDRISQVLLNLYLNAIESMAEGGRLSISTGSDPEKHLITIKVSDSGIGIGEEDLDRVFDPYFTTKASGTGLGLAITHNIVEAHGGQIAVDSRPGEGTTVTVTLPEAARPVDTGIDGFNTKADE
jgi:two-component system, NtrC family, sensor histidine kinase HydH